MKKVNKSNIQTNEQAREAEKLSNRIVTLSAGSILYAFLMLFLQKMSGNSETVSGAIAFIQFLFWGGIIGAMICAALGAYKENKNMFTYCAICVYILWSAIVVQYCGVLGSDKAYNLVYISLAVVFVMTQIFSVVSGKGGMSKKALTRFMTVSIVLFVLFCLAAIMLRFGFFGLMGGAGF